jgi:hypothetical protein
MKSVGVREFRDHATQYLAGDEPLAIERHGQTIGYYIPVGPTRKERFATALVRLEQLTQQIMDETGLTEEELSHLFDLSQPLPDPLPELPRKRTPDTRAPHR